MKEGKEDMPLVGKTMAEGHTHRMAVLCEKLGSTLREILDGTCPQPAKPEKGSGPPGPQSTPRRCQSRRRHRSARLWKSIGKLISFPLKSRDLKPCSSVRKLVVPWT